MDSDSGDYTATMWGGALISVPLRSKSHLLDSPTVSGGEVCSLLEGRGPVAVSFTTVEGPSGQTDFVTVRIPGTEGKQARASARSLGIIGRLGGIGARPEMIGLVSDADGALVALSAALKLADMAARGDRLPGDVIITTHICPSAPTRPHHPVPFMGAPVDSAICNQHEVTPEMDAALSIDTTQGNRLLNARGIAITPTVKEGYILRVSDGLQPCVITDIPIVGVALIAEVPVPGCATGASQAVHMEAAARFAIEVAKQFGAGKLEFHDVSEWACIQSTYGSLKHLQKGSQHSA